MSDKKSTNQNMHLLLVYNLNALDISSFLLLKTFIELNFADLKFLQASLILAGIEEIDFSFKD